MSWAPASKPDPAPRPNPASAGLTLDPDQVCCSVTAATHQQPPRAYVPDWLTRAGDGGGGLHWGKGKESEFQVWVGGGESLSVVLKGRDTKIARTTLTLSL